MRKILIISLAIFFASCTTSKKAKRYAYNNKEELAEWCSDCFPVKESELIKGDTIRDTLFNEVVDTLYKIEVDCPDGTIIHADCPPNKTVYKTINTHTSDTIRVRDSAKEHVLQSNIDKKDSELSKVKEKNRELKKYLFASLLAFAFLLFIKVR